jgi:hypothetical protein
VISSYDEILKDDWMHQESEEGNRFYNSRENYIEIMAA